MSEQLNPGHYHELADRVHIILCMLNDHVELHPVTQSDQELLQLVREASHKLGDAYQKIGQIKELRQWQKN